MRRYGALITIVSAIVGLLIAANQLDFKTVTNNVWKYTTIQEAQETPKERLALAHFGFNEIAKWPLCEFKTHEGVNYWCMAQCTTQTHTIDDYTYTEFKNCWECEEVAKAPCEQKINCDTLTFFEAVIGDTKLTRAPFSADGTKWLNQFPEVVLWATVLACLIALSFGAVPPILSLAIQHFQKTKELNPNGQGSLVYLICSVVLTIVCIMAAITLSNGNPLMSTGFDRLGELEIILNPDNAKLISTLGFVAPYFAIVAMLVLAQRAYELYKSKEQDAAKLEQAFEEIKRDLNQLLNVLGVLVSGAVIATSLFREALLDAVIVPDGLNIFPNELIKGYAAVLTAVLFICYVPVYGFIKSMGSNILTQIDDEADRESLQEVLTLKTPAMNNIAAALKVTAPFIAGLFSELMKNPF